MSFYRVGSQNRKKKAPVRKRATWDDTVNDLTVYRATPEEIFLRKEAHKSKNHISVKLEKMRKEKQRQKLTGAEAQQLAIMKEVLYNRQQFEDAIAKSDTMAAVVKDLFGDDPKRFMGFPNVTTAPNADAELNRTGSLVAEVPEIYTRTEKLSDSVMNQSALNDVDISDSEEDDDEIERPDPISYESKLNLQRFQQFLQEEEKLSSHLDPPTLVAMQNKDQGVKDQQQNVPNGSESKGQFASMLQLLRQSKNEVSGSQDAKLLSLFMAAMAGKEGTANSTDFKTPPKNQPSLPSDRTPLSAMNDTKKLKKTKKRTKPPSTSDSLNGTASMSDMRKVLQDLESEIATYEHQTGRRPNEDIQKTETFSGYTVALVNAVSRLTRYLKETELRVRTEVTLREQLTEDVYQLRTIIDALATDLIVTQEEYGKLFSEHKRYKENTQSELEKVNQQLHEIKELMMGRPPAISSANTAEQQQQQQQQQRVNASLAESKKSEESRTSTPLQGHQDTSTLSGSGEYQQLPAQLRSSETSVAAATAAVLLSPPVRKTRVHTNVSDMASKVTQRQNSLVDIVHLTGEVTRSTDPPRLTQAPPVMNTVSVPRPIPLVQSNVTVPLTSTQSSTRVMGQPIQSGQGSLANLPVQGNNLGALMTLGDQTEQNLHELQEMAVDEVMSNPALQSLMQSQIAELSRQQEEARRRLRDLLDNQRLQQKQLQDQLGSDVVLDVDFSPIRQEEVHRMCPQQDTMRGISPPISPISHGSERAVLKGMENLPTSSAGSRGISVSLPTVDLDVSGGSLTSPRSQMIQIVK